MKDIRLLIGALLVVVLSFGFVACGDDDQGEQHIPDSALTGKWYRVRSIGNIKYENYPEANKAWDEVYPVNDTCDYNVFEENRTVEMVTFRRVNKVQVKSVYNGTWGLSGQSLTIVNDGENIPSKITALTKTALWLEYSKSGTDEALGPYKLFVSTLFDKYYPPKEE